jgi:prolyl oligopeptidase
MPGVSRSSLLLTVCLFSGPLTAQDDATSEPLNQFFEAEWKRTLQNNPRWASQLGDAQYHDQWEDLSLDAIERRHLADRRALSQLEKFDPTLLTETDRLNLTLFRKRSQWAITLHPFQPYLFALNQRGGIQDANSLADSLQFQAIEDYHNWIERMRSLPVYMQQTIELLRLGAKRGIVHPRIIMNRIPRQIRRQIVATPEQSPFFKPFRDIPDSIDASTQTQLKRAASKSIREQVIPAYRTLLAFFETEYLPACLENVGVWQIPGGQQFYEYKVRQFTTTKLTPDEIHNIGIREVTRIRSQMEEIIREIAYDGNFSQFLEFLRTDKQFYFNNANDLIAAYQQFCRKVDPLLPRLFHRLPQVAYTIEAIPAQLAPDTTTAYYRPPSADGRRVGTYFVNLYRPEVRPKYEIPALSLHESVPGHHLQIALAMEREHMPAFRRYTGYTAFVEGWALYAEKLGEELQVYNTPYQRFGQLTYEMWRAVRLVVDTGIHSKKWTRQQAIDYFAEHTAKTQHDIENEIDRYIAWPGQALAYKIGELKIRQLRQLAISRLEDRFDIRDFHDIVLRNGAIPLDVLEQQVQRWLESTPSR